MLLVEGFFLRNPIYEKTANYILFSMDLDKIYKQRLDLNIIKQKKKIRIMRMIGNLRVILFVIMVFLLIKFFGSDFETMYLWWSFLGAVPVFALLVKIHQKHFEEKEIIDQLVQINEKELLVINTHQAQFDGGKEFIWPLLFCFIHLYGVVGMIIKNTSIR